MWASKFTQLLSNKVTSSAKSMIYGNIEVKRHLLEGKVEYLNVSKEKKLDAKKMFFLLLLFAKFWIKTPNHARKQQR